MKILFVNEFSLRYGGVDYVVNKQINTLKEEHSIKLFSIRHHDFISDQKRINIISLLKNSIDISRRLQSEIDQFQPDIIHFHNIYPLLSQPIWSKIKKRDSKIICHLHNFYPFCINSFFFREGEVCTKCFYENNFLFGALNKCYSNSYILSFFSSIYRCNPKKWIDESSKVDIFIAVSQFLKGKYINYGIPPEKIEVLHNFTDLEKTDNYFPGEYILFIGDFVEPKGIKLICEAAKLIPSIEFILAGDGRDLTKYQNNYKTVSNLKFVGYIDENKKRHLISNCRFVLLPYLSWEAFGIVILEANKLGKPVLSTGNGSSTELIIEGKNGRIFDNLLIDSVVDKIKSFFVEVGNHNSTYSKNCVEHAEKFGLLYHIERLTNIYRKCINE
jgi:glycosyltransferase involved in cell wall biosynthesis